MQKNPCSRFDKFNHVKYTKTLSVRNPRTDISLYWTAPQRIELQTAPYFIGKSRKTVFARPAHD